eukprot:COSAG03_NODE_884_length_5495_cov_25.434211_4_plen_108_part_00
MPMDGLPSSAVASEARMSNWNSGWLSIPPAVAPARFPLCHNALLSRGNCWVTAEAPSNPGAAEQDGASERDGAAHATRFAVDSAGSKSPWIGRRTAILPTGCEFGQE